MKTIIVLILCASTLLVTCKNDSCENTQTEVKEIMKTWYKKKISFPKNMEVLVVSSIVKE